MDILAPHSDWTICSDYYATWLGSHLEEIQLHTKSAAVGILHWSTAWFVRPIRAQSPVQEPGKDTAYPGPFTHSDKRNAAHPGAQLNVWISSRRNQSHSDIPEFTRGPDVQAQPAAKEQSRPALRGPVLQHSSRHIWRIAAERPEQPSIEIHRILELLRMCYDISCKKKQVVTCEMRGKLPPR